ncbi:MAG: M48 family metallopeptidase, partial [Usitatibacter sp.]
MSRFPADYYDGLRSTRHAVEVEVEGGQARIRGDGVSVDLPVGELHVHPRLGSLPLRIDLPGGGLLVASAEAIAGAIEMPPRAGLAHRLESHLGVILASLAGLAIAAWLGYREGIPWLAREVAYRLPPEIEKDLSTEGLEAMDRMWLRPSALPQERRARLREVFARLSAVHPELPARLNFRDGGFIGANAFALPGGAIVMTDELATALGDDDHIAAVLAHELGHLHHRHGARQILQASITALASAALLGDVSSVASLAATIPTVMLHTSYSRDFEREADRFAFELLRKTGRSPRLLGESLAALEKHQDASQECPVPRADDAAPEKPDTAPRKPSKARQLGYLSSHPP